MHLTKNTQKQLTKVFKKRRTCFVRPLSLSSAAFMAWELRQLLNRTVIVIADSVKTQDEMLRNLTSFGEEYGMPTLLYPALNSLPYNETTLQADIYGDRINTLIRMMRLNEEPVLICTCLQALTQPTFSPQTLRENIRYPTVSQQEDPEALMIWLEDAGYTFVPEVHNKGEAARRGGLLDIWTPQEPEPMRIEFFGSTIETIRDFDPTNQRSTGMRAEATIPPLNEREFIHSNEHEKSLFTDYLNEETLYFRFENTDPLTLPVISMSSDTAMDSNIGQRTHNTKAIDLDFKNLPPLIDERRNLLEPDLLEGRRRMLINNLAIEAQKGINVNLFFETQGALDRFRETNTGLPFRLHIGFISDGFINPTMRFAVAGENLLAGRRKKLLARSETRYKARAQHKRSAGETITDWTGIKPGEFVVHIDHGIGKYLGITEMDFDGQLTESLAIEYADKAKLYIPVAQCHLLSRYIGAGKHHPRLHRLGSASWSRAKQSAERAIKDLAASLLRIQAIRESKEGFSFPPDDSWQHDFEAAFPYEETQDQEYAITQVKADMEATRPMDRLICGDAGYGKTEVALRASFKSVTAGKQVALLVPTTVLAQQHYDFFSDRMRAYPFNIELLSRFRSLRQQQQSIKNISDRTADIVIGTHRLLQSDVKFKDLGLVIIDEEQRFGVAHKEKFKHMRQLVDVLTLTATPIPRTLYLGLTGARDISMIQTAPAKRVSIETIVAPKEDRVVQDAVRRELNREGQVYYLHNRIATIERARAALERLVPEARIVVAHGLTPSAELAKIMHAFEQGAFDILICTTIIQSGVDIPNANTIIIDRADRFGVADLYQLRGRVGRSSRNAYAYLLLPKNERLLDTSRKRIHAIVQHSELGSGFRLAMRDLEIRGAGNLLGQEQSGHIAAVGFDLYCQLLKHTVTQLTSNKPGSILTSPFTRIVDTDIQLDFIQLATHTADIASAAFLPHSYIEDEQLRLRMYRKIASSTDLEDIKSLRDEFHDRFGEIPPPLDRLLKIASLRIVAALKNVSSIETRDNRIMFKQKNEYIMMNNRFPRFDTSDPGKRIDEIFSWLDRVDDSGGWRENQ